MQKGDFIRIDYVGRLESGEIFDLTNAELAKKEKIFNPNMKYAPAAVIVGAGFVIKGLDDALLTMSIGEKRDVIIKPEDAFGQRNVTFVRTVQSKLFKHPPEPGQVVDFGNLRGRVQSVSAGRVRVDFNHPLAGKTLKYDVELKEKIDGHVPQIEAIVDFFGVKAEVELNEKTANLKAKLPQQLKERISKLILEHVKGVEKVNFVESFEKTDSPKEPSKS